MSENFAFYPDNFPVSSEFGAKEMLSEDYQHRQMIVQYYPMMSQKPLCYRAFLVLRLSGLFAPPCHWALMSGAITSMCLPNSRSLDLHDGWCHLPEAVAISEHYGVTELRAGFSAVDFKLVVEGWIDFQFHCFLGFCSPVSIGNVFSNNSWSFWQSCFLSGSFKV